MEHLSVSPMRALHWCLWTRKRLLATFGALLLLVVVASHL